MLMAATMAASAATLDIPGPYGNAAGCRYAATSDYGDDTLLLLTPQEVTTFATGCAFTAIHPQGDGAFVIDVLCSHEGETYQTSATMRVEKERGAVDLYAIFDEDGALWGKVGRC